MHRFALLAHGSNSPELEVYERDIAYYKNFAQNRLAAEEYDAFKLGRRRSLSCKVDDLI